MDRKKMLADQLTEIRRAKAEYAKKWRRQNPEKSKAIQERYWLKRAAKLAAENK